MRLLALLKPACPLALAFVLASPLAATLHDVAAVMNRDGLEPIQLKNMDLAYARPGATLAAYKRIQIEPVLVDFDKRWDPERTGSRLKVSSEERVNIQASVSRAVRDEFARVLQATGNYQVVNEAGPDVLRFTPRIINLYLNAPDAGNVARTRTYMASAGEMTLLAELHDSASSQLLMRLADRREADNVRLIRTNGMVNDNEIRVVVGAWARVLRKALDQAHGIAP
jgi:hypothetical protein